MYNITVHVGVYWEGYDYDLKPSRFFWTAWPKAKWELFWYPYRTATIKGGLTRKVLWLDPTRF